MGIYVLDGVHFEGHLLLIMYLLRCGVHTCSRLVCLGNIMQLFLKLNINSQIESLLQGFGIMLSIVDVIHSLCFDDYQNRPLRMCEYTINIVANDLSLSLVILADSLSHV